MSEAIICRGDKNKLNPHFEIDDIDTFLSQGLFWLEDVKGEYFSFCYDGKGIDEIITDAQGQMHNGLEYTETTIYKILNILIDHHISFAMWYDIYFDDLDLCSSKEEVLETCRQQILDVSGMCEVYIVSKL